MTRAAPRLSCASAAAGFVALALAWSAATPAAAMCGGNIFATCPPSKKALGAKLAGRKRGHASPTRPLVQAPR